MDSFMPAASSPVKVEKTYVEAWALVPPNDDSTAAKAMVAMILLEAISTIAIVHDLARHQTTAARVRQTRDHDSDGDRLGGPNNLRIGRGWWFGRILMICSAHAAQHIPVGFRLWTCAGTTTLGCRHCRLGRSDAFGRKG